MSLLGTELAAGEREIAARRRRLVVRFGALLDCEECERRPGIAIGEHLVAASLALGCGRDGKPAVAPDLVAQLTGLCGEGPGGRGGGE